MDAGQKQAMGLVDQPISALECPPKPVAGTTLQTTGTVPARQLISPGDAGLARSTSQLVAVAPPPALEGVRFALVWEEVGGMEDLSAVCFLSLSLSFL